MYLEQFGKADLHIHSDYSDGKMSIEKILAYAETKTDLDIIAITDHDTIAGAKLAQKIAIKRKMRVKVVVGEEISCKEGHILALFIDKKISPGLSVEETLSEIEKQSGIAIVPHPLYHTRFQKKGIVTIDGIGFVALVEHKDKFDAVETLNANPILRGQNHRMHRFNKSYLLKPEIGGSDAHILEAIGVGYTAFEGKDIESLKFAIANDRTLAFSNKWKTTSLLKYAFFFLPQGLKLLFYAIVHGRVKKRQTDFEKAKLLLIAENEKANIELSQVIPVYNEEKFLPEC